MNDDVFRHMSIFLRSRMASALIFYGGKELREKDEAYRRAAERLVNDLLYDLFDGAYADGLSTGEDNRDFLGGKA